MSRQYIVKYFIAFKKNKLTDNGEYDNIIEYINNTVSDKYTIIIPPPQHFYADPFVYKNLVFFEDFDSYKGCISCIDLLDPSLTPKIVLDKPYHLSYPYIFEYDGEVYMIPETCTEKQIQLFKFSENLSHSQFCKTLIDNVIAPDVSVIIKDDGIFLFTCTPDYGCTLIYHAKTLFDEYRLIHKHRNSRQETRGAGKIVFRDNNYYRPVQIIKPYYGYGTVCYRIDELTTHTYKETRISPQLDINWFPQNKGTHTLCFDKDYIAIDALIHVGIHNAKKTQTWKQRLVPSSSHRFIYTDNDEDDATSTSFLKSLTQLYLNDHYPSSHSIVSHYTNTYK